MILAQQNAGNIQYLKDKLATYEKIPTQINDLSANVASLTTQVQTAINSQSTKQSQLNAVS
jgi:hypothetical protein